MDQDTTNLIIARLNSVAVSVEDLVLASHEVEQRDWEGSSDVPAKRWCKVRDAIHETPVGKWKARYAGFP
jgi:hypothetical protein